MNRARLVWFLVSGAGKAQALARVLHGPEDHDATPAQAVARHAREVEFFVDAAALPGLAGAARAAQK
jgi:6-phosphogluconolactonase